MHASCSLKTQNTMVHMSEFHWDVRLKRIDALCIGQWSCLARRSKAEKKCVIEPSIPLIFSDLISAPVVWWWAHTARWLVWKPSMISVQRDDLPQNLKGWTLWNLNRAEAPSMDCLVSHILTLTKYVAQRFTPKVKIIHPPPLWSSAPLLVLWTDKFPLPLTQAPPPCTPTPDPEPARRNPPPSPQSWLSPEPSLFSWPLTCCHPHILLSTGPPELTNYFYRSLGREEFNMIRTRPHILSHLNFCEVVSKIDMCYPTSIFTLTPDRPQNFPIILSDVISWPNP